MGIDIKRKYVGQLYHLYYYRF